MVVCKYYLQGNCHFGERCRFEHPRQQGFGQNQGFSGGQSGKFQNSFGGGNNRFAPLNNAGGGDGNRATGQQTIKDMSPQDIINVICQEMKVWESSNMWPFSCFTYAKDGVCMAGFDDLSPEELRAEAYQMQKDNNFQTYQNKVQQLVNEYRMKRQVLRAPQPDIKQKLLQEIQAHKASAAKPAGQSGAFGAKTVSGGFGSTTTASQGLFGKAAQPTPGLFGSNPATQNQFGQQQPQPARGLFGRSQTSQNLFGKSQPSQDLFGKSQTAPTQFGQAQTGQSTFGQAQTGQSTFGGSALFGGAPAPSVSQGSVFGSSAQTQGSVFGAPATAQTQPTGTFGATPAPTPGLFGGQNNPAPTGLFGKPAAQPAGSGMFGNTQTALAQPATQPTGLFGKGAPAPAPTGLFGKPAVSTGSMFGGNPAPSLGGAPTSQPQPGQATLQASSIYTPLADLTDEEKAQFTAAKFVLGKIPTRPPPREMVS